MAYKAILIVKALILSSLTHLQLYSQPYYFSFLSLARSSSIIYVAQDWQSSTAIKRGICASARTKLFCFEDSLAFGLQLVTGEARKVLILWHWKVKIGEVGVGARTVVHEHSYNRGAVLRNQDQPHGMSCQASSDKSNSVFFNCLVLSWFLFVAVFLFSCLLFWGHFCPRSTGDLTSFLFLIVFVWWITRSVIAENAETLWIFSCENWQSSCQSRFVCKSWYHD